MKTLRLLATAVLCASLVAPMAATAEEVNVYSARKEALIKPLLDKFTVSTGIKVNLVTGSADALLERIKAEGLNTPADVLITADAGRLHRAKSAGVLVPLDSATLREAVPAQLRDPEDYWVGLSMRVRPIIYATAKVDPTQLSTYEALADPRWKGRVCIRSSSNIYNQSLVASMIAAAGEEKTREWLDALVSNFARAPSGGDTDQIRAVAAGECDVAIANNYYLGRLQYAPQSDADAMAGKRVALFWPNQSGRGVHVNVSGAGVTRAAGNRENAIKLLEYLVSNEAQQWYAEVNYEYPVKTGVSRSVAVNGWGEFKADALSLAVLGENNALAVKLMDRAGWK